MDTQPCYAAILINGGHSCRLGMDKNHLKLDDMPVVVENLHRWQITFSEIIIAGRPIPELSHAVAVQDILADAGPLAGLHAGLSASHQPYNLAIACDIPLIPTVLIHRLLDKAWQTQAEIVVPRSKDGKIHPLCAVYARHCLEKAAQQLAIGKRSMKSLLDICQTHYLDICQTLWNINTPADMEKFIAAYPAHRLVYAPTSHRRHKTNKRP